MESLPEALELAHRNLYEQTIESFRHRERPCFSVRGRFKEFSELMEKSKN